MQIAVVTNNTSKTCAAGDIINQPSHFVFEDFSAKVHFYEIALQWLQYGVKPFILLFPS